MTATPHGQHPEAIKPRPDYPPKTPPAPKKPPSPPAPDPKKSETTTLLKGLPVPQRAAQHPGAPRPTALMKNRPGVSWTLENAPWAAMKAADQVGTRLTEWGWKPPEKLHDIVKALVTAVLADGGRRISVHMSEQRGRVLVLALSHQANADTDADERELLAELNLLGTASCGTETTADGRQVWALLEPAPFAA